MMLRRDVLALALLGAPMLSSRRVAADEMQGDLQDRFAALERRHGGRLGVAIVDTAAMKVVAYRGDERFPLCSTFKLLAAACVLARVDRDAESLARKVVYTERDLVPYAPITKLHVGAEGGLSLGEICDAAISVSDNTAGNLMLDSFGGPASLTAYLRSLGDNVTRLDRREPELNEAAPGDPRDTTTPRAMAETVRKLVLGDALSASSKAQLIAWLVACRTGGQKLRAGLPSDWRIGDKTGSGSHDATNDIAVVWPPGRAPLVVTTYYVEAQGSDSERDAVLSEVGRLAAMI